MPDTTIQIKRIQDKLHQLIKKHEEVLKENQQLKKELKKNSDQSTEQLRKIETLKQQVEVLKISSGSWDEQDKKDFEKRINHYIREIDKCIALLSE